MKIIKKLSVLLVCFLIIFSFGAYAETKDEIVLYVAVGGLKTNDGLSPSAPLPDLNSAKLKIRELRKYESTDSLTHATVNIGGGIYELKATEYFNAADSSVTYQAYGNEKPVFTGGYRAYAEEFSDIVLDNGKTVKTFNIKTFLEDKTGKTIDDTYYYPMQKVSSDDESFLSRMMYSTDKNPALYLARYPNKKEGYYPENPHSKFLYTGEIIKETNSSNGDTEGSIFKYTDPHISSLAGAKDAYFFGMPEWVFYTEEMKIEEINPSDMTIKTAVAPPMGIDEGKEYFIFNVLSELDTKGEYFVDRDGSFYMYPEDDFTYLNIPYFNSNYLMSIQNTNNVLFKGLTFENARKNGFRIYGGENVRIEDCEFYNFCETAVFLGSSTNICYTPFHDSKWDSLQYDLFYKMTDRQEKIAKQIEYWEEKNKTVAVRGKNHGIYNSKVMNTGLSGVELTGGNLFLEEECGYYVENCDISFSGVNKRHTAPGINLSNVNGAVIKNNELSHFPSSAISGYASNTAIEYNEIYDGLSEPYDVSLVYLNYIVPALNITIRNNYLHDVPSETSITGSNSIPSQRSGIGFDSTYGCQTLIENNIIENIQRGMFVQNGAEVRNNIIINSFDPVYTGNYSTFEYWNLSKLENPDYDEFFSSENYSIYPEGMTYMEVWPIFGESEKGEEYRQKWTEKYPDFMDWVDAVINQKHNGKPFFDIHNNLIVNDSGYWWSGHKKLGDVPFASEKELGNNEPDVGMNVYRTNTECFRDFKNKDYTLTYSAKLKYGMNSIDMSEIGIITK